MESNKGASITENWFQLIDPGIDQCIMIMENP